MMDGLELDTPLNRHRAPLFAHRCGLYAPPPAWDSNAMAGRVVRWLLYPSVVWKDPRTRTVLRRTLSQFALTAPMPRF